MKKYGGIYMIRNVENNKKYIGSTCASNGFVARFVHHRGYLRIKANIFQKNIKEKCH